MADYGLTIFFEKTGESAWLSYKDYVRHIGYGLVRAGLPLLYTEGFQERALLQAPPALPLGVSSLGEPFFIPMNKNLSLTANDLKPYFLRAETPVLVLNYKLPHYLSLFKTPSDLLKLDLEKQGLKRTLDEQHIDTWDVVKVGIEMVNGEQIDLSLRTAD
ncbi:DUF2344 domain-containing protein [Coprothermobacter platensis]|uniref:DUF2344 domain-containing protein n=1 Tax=Coprothermobacter platensis TaxID=108819 RepID=UPI000368D326|nr:DUF2344 domain-containing protein [Coprothermobacter platensis]